MNQSTKKDKKDQKDRGVDPVEDILDPKKGLAFFIVRLFKGIVHSDKKIGEMNGKWAALFRVVLVLLFLTIPAFGTWAMWVTKGMWKSQEHISTTSNFDERLDLLEQDDVIIKRIDKTIDKIQNDIKSRPNPNQMKQQIEENSDAIHNINGDVIQLDKTNTEQHNKISKEINEKISSLNTSNSADHARMVTTLEFIKEKVSKK